LFDHSLVQQLLRPHSLVGVPAPSRHDIVAKPRRNDGVFQLDVHSG